MVDILICIETTVEGIVREMQNNNSKQRNKNLISSKMFLLLETLYFQMKTLNISHAFQRAILYLHTIYSAVKKICN